MSKFWELKFMAYSPFGVVLEYLEVNEILPRHLIIEINELDWNMFSHEEKVKFSRLIERLVKEI